MDSKLSAILADLYRLDPSLKEREEELVPVLKALLRAQPETTFDARFAAQLRKKLFTSANLSQPQPSMSPSAFHKFAFAGLGGLIALVIAIPIAYQLTQPGTSFDDFSLSEVSTAPTINSLGSDAFGQLALTASAPLGSEQARSSVAFGTGGSPAPALAPAADGVSEDAVGSDDKMADADLSIAPGEPYPGGLITYAYTYTGEAIDLSAVSDAVYRKTGGLELGGLGNDLMRAKIGPVDMGAFRNLELQSFSVKQPDKNGYSVYVDPTYGMITVNGNEGIWGYTNGEYTPMTEGQIMSDEALIATADKFLSDFAIDTTGFGAPVVDNRSLSYALSQPASLRYIPEAVSVTYPLLLEGQPTYTSDGSPFGLYVFVNMRTQTVASVSLNVASSYDKSSYELERDSATILKLAAQGGLYNYPYEGATETVTIELGTPSVILINHYTYNGTESETLFIPALSFPVTKNSETYPIYSDAVVIPLVKSVIEEAGKEPIYRILETDAEAVR